MLKKGISLEREKYLFKVLLIALTISYSYCPSGFARPDEPTQYNIEDLVNIADINNRIIVNLAYSTPDNFLSQDLYGSFNTCYLRKEAAIKLDIAQSLLEQRRQGFKLIVYDGLRPRNVQYQMWRVVKGTPQEDYVADPEKGSLHNFGAAVDVSIVDDQGLLLDMGTPFDYFGELAQPRYEIRFLSEGRLTAEQINNRKLLREVMTAAGFQSIQDEWWHFNAFSPEEVKRRYEIVEFILPQSKIDEVLTHAQDLPRDGKGFCVVVKGLEKKLYLIAHNTIELVCDSAIGKNGLGKTKEGDGKTPLGDYQVKWMVSRNGPSKANPGGLSSFVVDEKTYAVLDTELYFGALDQIRVKLLPDGTRKVSDALVDRPITPEEIEIAQDEKLWTAAYGGAHVYVMALNYPNTQDRAEGRTGSCIEIHASAHLEEVGHTHYSGTLGCIVLYPSDAKRIYTYVNPGTPVRIVK